VLSLFLLLILDREIPRTPLILRGVLDTVPGFRSLDWCSSTCPIRASTAWTTDLAYALARIAWHEWAHALSIHRATEVDVLAGKRLLEQVPPALAENVRSSGYLRREYTHEIVAEIYAMLMIRRRLDGAADRPDWLSQEVYDPS
jgi:hypothetical protein